MDFFKRKIGENSSDDLKLVGAFVPTNIFHYLNLFCVADKRSKSSILIPIIEDWYKKAHKSIPEKKLIKLIAELGYANYTKRKRKRPFDIILKQQEKELRKKGISEDNIKSILKKIKQLHESKESKK